MGVEAQWAFGIQMPADFVAPPAWVRRVILMTFGIDPDAEASNKSIDPIKVSKMVGSLLGLAQGAEIVFRPNEAISPSDKAVLTEEKLKKGVRLGQRAPGHGRGGDFRPDLGQVPRPPDHPARAGFLRLLPAGSGADPDHFLPDLTPSPRVATITLDGLWGQPYDPRLYTENCAGFYNPTAGRACRASCAGPSG